MWNVRSVNSPAGRTRVRRVVEDCTDARVPRARLVLRRGVDVDGDERLAAGVTDLVALPGFDEQKVSGLEPDRAALDGCFPTTRDDVEPLIGARMDVFIAAGRLTRVEHHRRSLRAGGARDDVEEAFGRS